MSNKRKAKKKTRLTKRFLLFFTVLVIVCLSVFVLNKTGSLRKIIYMLGSGISDNAQSSSIAFDANDSNRFHLSKQGLTVLASDGLRVYDISGKENHFTPLAYRSPALSGDDKHLAVYDRGNTDFTIKSGDDILTQAQAAAPIVSINMSRNGAFSVVTAGPDCKNLVTVYNAECKEIYKLYSTDEYVSSAAVSPDGKRMVTISYTAANGEFQGKLFFYNLKEEAPYHTISLPGVLPLSASFSDSDDIVVICEDSLLRLGANGEEHLKVPFDGGKLAFSATQSHKFSAVLLDKFSTLGCYELISSPRNETQVSRIQFSEDVFSMSSAGNYLAVQFSDRVTVYKSDLTEHNTFTIPARTSSCIVRSDGSVLLIGNNWANLMVP